MFSFLKKSKATALYAPVAGVAIELGAVNDPVFNSGMMGPGFAVQPSAGAVFAPVSGKIMSIFPTKHAVTMRTPQGVELLIHLGLDTVALQGQGFEILVAEGQQVEPTTQLAEVDLAFLAEQEKENTVIVVFPDLPAKQTVTTEVGVVEPGTVIGQLTTVK